MKKRTRILSILLVLVFISAMIPAAYADDTVTVTNVTMSPSTLSLTMGGTTGTLTATVTLSDGTSNQSVTWASSNTSVANVSNGTVTAVAAGIAIITATAADDSSKTATCEVTVEAAAPTTVTVTNVTMSPSTLSLTIGGTTTGALTATVTLSDGSTNKNVTWESSNTSVATVSNGTVTAVKAGSATITATAVDDNSQSATCTVTVNAATTTTGSISLSKSTLSLTVGDTSTLTPTVTPTGSTVTWTSSSTSVATVSSSGLVTAKAAGTATITAAITVSGTTYSASCTVTVTAATTTLNTIYFSVSAGGYVTFSISDFNSLVYGASGYNLNYVTFTLPSSSTGVLYYNYTSSSSYDSTVYASTSYYYNGSSSKAYLSKVSFAAASSYSGTVSISYTAYDTNGSSFTGTVKVSVDVDSITYTTNKDKAVTFSASDFNTYSKSVTGSNLSYVQFTLPSSAKGTLYYNYTSSSSYDSKALASTKYYRSSSPSLDNVTFVPADGYTGSLTVSFTGESVDGDSLSGSVKITVSGDPVTIKFSAAAGEAVTMTLSSFNDSCKDSTGSNLDYVKFTLPSSSIGVLYYEYTSGGSYGSKVLASTKYYRASSPYLADVTFVPADSSAGKVSISFTGESAGGGSFSGTVEITYGAAADAAVITYSTTTRPVSFNKSDFVTACAARGQDALSSVRFALPSSNAGKLYYGYEGPTKYSGLVSSSVSFDTGTGESSISNVVFVPKAGYSGAVTISYTGTDSGGSTFTGYVTITVTPPTTSTYFSDLSNHIWAVASVEYIYENGITTGTSATTYNPTGQITRGDFVLMLYRAFEFGSGETDNFTDVPAGSYYAEAIAAAKALGIAQGNGGLFRPGGALTREDAMVLIQRTMNACGYSVSDAASSYLDGYSDGGSVSSYAQGAVAALCQAGVIKGDDSGKLSPKNSLTRAEMAVILHRVLTL